MAKYGPRIKTYCYDHRGKYKFCAKGFCIKENCEITINLFNNELMLCSVHQRDLFQQLSDDNPLEDNPLDDKSPKDNLQENNSPALLSAPLLIPLKNGSLNIIYGGELSSDTICDEPRILLPRRINKRIKIEDEMYV